MHSFLSFVQRKSQLFRCFFSPSNPWRRKRKLKCSGTVMCKIFLKSSCDVNFVCVKIFLSLVLFYYSITIAKRTDLPSRTRMHGAAWSRNRCCLLLFNMSFLFFIVSSIRPSVTMSILTLMESSEPDIRHRVLGSTRTIKGSAFLPRESTCKTLIFMRFRSFDAHAWAFTVRKIGIHARFFPNINTSNVMPYFLEIFSRLLTEIGFAFLHILILLWLYRKVLPPLLLECVNTSLGDLSVVLRFA